MMHNRTVRGTTVFVKEGDDINRALRKFKNKVEDAGTLKDLKDRECYEKPSITRKKKAAAAKARWRKTLQNEQLPPKQF